MALECYQRAWEVLEQMLIFAMFVRLWVVVSIAKALSVFLPHQTSSSVMTSMLDILSNPFPGEEKACKKGAGFGPSGSKTNRLLLDSAPNNGIGRALSQTLELVNDTPASSRKYGFVRGVADKLLFENIANGSEALVEVNRLALKVGFSRTLCLLVQFLDRRRGQLQTEALSWPWRILKGHSQGGTTFPLPSVPFLGSIWNVLSVLFQLSPESRPVAVSSNSLIIEDEEVAEKLVQELLWMAERLKECSAIEDAIIQWSAAASLASLSRHASPRVQHYLMKISIFLLQGMTWATFTAPEDVSLHLLLLWLPLLCTPMSGIDGNNFTASQRLEAEILLAQIIVRLPKMYQESILAVWVREFTESSSDWPNLQNCYDSWCHEIRLSKYGTCDNGK
ncbi:hypothetical protein O6H91_12G063200 [Diphasiastrum complanatum]|nr:hypothetical protein O6H91_12G063200 [Diphasiastrum complanatum]KAJ7536284.1 hypothetical protein O6H91_12G063200 [Diphasiastrum complanatum]